MSLFKVTPPGKNYHLTHCKHQSGQALAEVALILALICVVTIVAMTATGTSIDGLLDTISGVLGGDLVPEAPGGDTPGEDVGGSSGGGAGGTMSAALAEAITFADGDSGFTKGHNVTINGAEYKVLKVNGNEVTLMGMTNLGSGNCSSGATTTFSDGGSYLMYEGSNLDRKMTTFYNGLPEAVQNAIVEKNVTQKVYRLNTLGSGGTQVASATKSDGSAYQIFELGSVAVGNRKVWAPGVEDVIDYLGDSWTSADLMNMFYDSPSTGSKSVWLRSAMPYSSKSVFRVYGDYGYLGGNYGDSRDYYEARPAFIINIAA